MSQTGRLTITVLAVFSFLQHDAVQARPMSSCGVCLSVSVTFVDSVKTNKHIIKIFHHRVATPLEFFRAKRHSNNPTETPLTGELNAGGVGRNRYSQHISGSTACVNAATGQVLSTWSPVDHSQYDTLLVVSGGVDCGRRQRNVYDKKPQR